MIEHVRAWAAGNGFELRQDAARNLVVRVPATAGRESAPAVVLQGHLDMVCERLPDSPNDPAEGRIELLRDGDWLTADGTTLGADNGIGIAAMMALAEDASLPHGPLELLMTVERGGRRPGRGRERARPLARQRGDAAEPGQRGGRQADRRLCEQHRHVDPGREAAGAVRAGRGDAVGVGRAAGSAGIPAPTSRAAAPTRSRCSGARCARRSPSLRSGSSRCRAAGAGTPSLVTRPRSARCRPSERPPSAPRSRPRPRRSGTPTRKTDPGVAMTVDGARRRGGCVDGGRDRGPARPRRGRPERAARDESRLPGARRDEHLGRRGGHRRRTARSCTASRARRTAPRSPR